jgi:hypothetical protein
MLGRTAAPHGHGRDTGLGYDHFEVVVDDATRLAYVAHVALPRFDGQLDYAA